MLQFTPVMAAKYQAMTQAAGHTAANTSSRQASAAAAAARARRARARVACAALLRWIYSMVVHGTSWDAAVAAGDAACQHAPRRPAEAA